MNIYLYTLHEVDCLGSSHDNAACMILVTIVTLQVAMAHDDGFDLAVGRTLFAAWLI